MHHLGWGGLFVFITCFSVGIFVYLKDRKRLLNKIWAAFALSVAIFGFGFFKVDTAASSESALFWWQFMYTGVIFIAVFFLHFNFILVDNKNRKALYFLYPANFIFLIFNLSSRLFFKSVTWKFSNVWYADAGGLYIYFFYLWWGTVAYSAFLIYKNYQKSSGIKRNQFKYWFLAIVVGYFGGIFCYLPVFNINIIYPYPIYLIALWPLILTYAIIRYRVFEIDTVIHRTLLWLLASGLILVPLGAILYLSRLWISRAGFLKLALFGTALFYTFFYYYRNLQPKVDHVFRRKKYDYYKILAEMAQNIGSELEIQQIVKRLLREISGVLYIRNCLILVQDKSRTAYTEIGSIGYNSSLAVEKEGKTELSFQHPLCEWLNIHQKAIEREPVEADPRYAPIKEAARSFFKRNSLEVLIPVLLENKINALIGLGKKENLQAFRFNDIKLLENMGRQIGVIIDNALHHQDIVEKERLTEELRLGRQIQMDLLPKAMPSIPGLSVSGFMRPAKEIGGDYYDFIPLPKSGGYGIAIGDVSGKGVAAGLMMAIAKTALHSISQEQLSPRETLIRVNQVLYQHIGGQKFMTLLYLCWNIRDNVLYYSSAGHEHIVYFQQQTGTISLIKSGGVLLGIMEDVSQYLEDRQLTLGSGDRIILYTDGVIEVENPQGEKFGLDRLKGLVEASNRGSSGELIGDIQEELAIFAAGRPLNDDITLVVLIKE